MSAAVPVRADSSVQKRIEPQSKVVGSDVPNNVHSNVPDVVHSKTGSNGKPKQGTVSVKDVLAHKDGDEVWVVIKGDVYKWVSPLNRVIPSTDTDSMTEFLDDHPGGREIIENNRSKDVTPIFNPRHPSDQLDDENIPPNVHRLGPLDVDGASDEEKEAIRLKVSKEEEEEETRIKRERKEMEERGLGVIVNMKDFEVSAPQTLWSRYRLSSRNSPSQCSPELLGHTTPRRVMMKLVSLAYELRLT